MGARRAERMPGSHSRRSLHNLKQLGSLVANAFVIVRIEDKEVVGSGGTDSNGLGGFVTQGDFHAVNGVDGGVAGGSAAEGRNQCVRDETHVHEVVLDGFREFESNQDSSLADFHFA